MRSIIVKIVAVVAAVVAIATSSYATEIKGGGGDTKKVQVELIQRDDHTVTLHFQKPEKQLIKMKITNTVTKEVVFTGFNKKHSLAIITYDLSHLPKGNYKIEVTAGEAVFTKSVEL